MDTKDRILNFVRWHNETLFAPATAADILNMVTSKGVAYDDAGRHIVDLVTFGRLRFVESDYLLDGYAVVEDPS